MRIRLFTLAALTSSIALGNLCMMQMASAQEMPHDMGMMHGSMSDDGDCEHCSKEHAALTETPTTTDCSSGHCFMHAVPVESDSLQAPSPPMTVAFADTLPVSLSVPADLFRAHRSTAPPGFIAHTKTIVLRC